MAGEHPPPAVRFLIRRRRRDSRSGEGGFFPGRVKPQAGGERGEPTGEALREASAVRRLPLLLPPHPPRRPRPHPVPFSPDTLSPSSVLRHVRPVKLLVLLFLF